MGEENKAFTKKKLLQWLAEDQDVRAAVWEIVAAWEPYSGQGQMRLGDAGATRYEEQQIQELQSENNELSRQFAAERERRREAGKTVRELRVAQQRLAGENQKLQADYARLQEEYASIQKAQARLKERIGENISEGLRLYDELSQSAAGQSEAWHQVVPRPGFAAFIVGLSQADALERLWDIAYAAIENGESPTVIEFWRRLFTYSLCLVNLTTEQDIYVCDEARTGERYDRARHEKTRTSQPQGYVRTVLLAGYRNCYTGEQKRRSLVEVE